MKEVIICNTKDIVMSDIGRLGREGYTMEIENRDTVYFYK